MMMNPEIQLIWQEVIADISTPAAGWQLGVLVIALVTAWLINGALRAYVMRHAPEQWKRGIGGINRVLFPLSTLIIVQISKLVLNHWQHTGILHLASTLLVAMALIRLLVYAVRYIISPGGLLKTLENALSGFIWAVLALHLSGLLPEILIVLKEVEFTIGKTTINLLVILQAALIIFTTIFVALWCSRMIENKLMQNDNINMNMRVVLSKVLRIAFIFLAVLIGLSAVGLDFTLLSVFGGALGVGLGFGLQRIASNYVSGFILLLDNSIKIGDIITVNELHYGIIADLRTRYLVLKKLDGTEVIVPNEMLITNTVINHSFLDRNTRVLLDVQVAYESDLELVMKLLREAAEKQPRVLVTPEPTSAIKAFADSGIDMTLSVWIPDPENGQLALKSQIYLDIWKLFKANNISIPFPQREVRVLNKAIDIQHNSEPRQQAS
jgi:small-conductance mechanosensitive channel